MEDEECLPENSNLKTYLQSLGYSDMQIKESPPSPSIINYDAPCSKLKKTNLEFIDEDIINQVRILISTQMLFEEDVRNLENVLSNFKVKKYGMLKNMFQGTFGYFIILIGLLLYWFIGSYSFFIGSSFYAYKAADYLWKKHFSQRRIQKLVSILQSNYALLSKAVKFINENDKFIGWKNINNNNVMEEFNDGFKFYMTFKCDFHASLNEVIKVLSFSTKKLIAKLPLCDYIENPKYYICNNYNENCESSDIFKLYQIYLLVQSEFLQRFILSLIPNLNVSDNSNFQELNRILTEGCIALLKIKNNLNRKFKFIFFNGVHSAKSKANLNIFVRPKNHTLNYEEELVSNIHDVSNTFQNLLIKSRILEENLKVNKLSSDMENDLINLQSELNMCQRNISDGFILLKKASGINDAKEEIGFKVDENESAPGDGGDNVEKKKIIVGFTDLDPAIEDEIFEAYFGEEGSDPNHLKFDDWDFEDLVKKKLQKEYSKNVIAELKTKLIEKAKKREKTEAEILSKKRDSDNSSNDGKGSGDVKSDGFCVKNDILSVNGTGKNTSVSVPPECDTLGKDFLTSELLSRRPRSSIVTREINHNDRKMNQNTINNEDLHQECLGMFVKSKNFLTDLNLARQRILQKSGPEEELCFCDSDSENSEDGIFEK